MSDRPMRGELISWPDPRELQGDADVDSVGPGSRSPASASAALVAARNEIALLRARVARLEQDNERLATELARSRG